MRHVIHLFVSFPLVAAGFFCLRGGSLLLHPLIAISYRGAPGREAHVAGYVVAAPGPREIFNRRIGAGGGSFSAHLTPSFETHTHTGPGGTGRCK